MAENALSKLLSRGEPGYVLMDGGMGSTVEDRGVGVRTSLWGSVTLLTPEGRELNDEVHRDFIRAGAELLIANSHNGSLRACRAFLEETDTSEMPLPPEVLDASGEEHVEAFQRYLNAEAVASARRAAGGAEGISVTAGVGSAEGAFATKSGIEPEEAADRLEPQVRILTELEVDLVIFETLTTSAEIEGVAVLAERLGLDGFGAGLACGPDGRTLGGVTIERAVEMLRPVGPRAVFIQCTAFDLALGPLRALSGALGDSAAAGVYANDGRKWIGMRWHGPRTTPAEYAEQALGWREAGARIIGGCCGMGPDHVAAIRDRLK